MSTIQSLDSAISGHGDSFIFITDLHNEDRHYSTAISKYIQDNSDVSRTIYGGDYINEPNGYNLALSLMTSRIHSMTIDSSTIFLKGNHDSNPYADGQLPDNILQPLFTAHLKSSINTNGKLYYYEDNTTEKIRYIYLDTGINGSIDATQATWFANSLNLSSDWTVVIMSHMATVDGGYDVRTSNNFFAVVSTLETAINNAVPTIACWICGHNHIDIYNSSRFSFPIICTTCDAHSFQASTASSDARVEGTINEQSFNVFHIDTSDRKIYMTRIGGGQVNVIQSGDYTDNDVVFTY